MLLQYRAAALAGCATQLFWGLIRVMIFEAFYNSTTTPQPMNISQVITYIWLGQAMLGMLPWSADVEIRDQVRTGAVAYELVRPLDLYFLWYGRAIASRLAPTLLRAIPLFIVAGLFFGLHAPPSWGAAVAWALSTLGALLTASAFGTLLNISLLWTVSAEGLSRLGPAVVTALSGMLIPLPLYPPWLQPVVRGMPFRAMVDLPFRLYSGNIPVSELGSVIAQQVGWTVALILAGRWLLSRGVRRLVVQGG